MIFFFGVWSCCFLCNVQLVAYSFSNEAKCRLRVQRGLRATTRAKKRRKKGVVRLSCDFGYVCCAAVAAWCLLYARTLGCLLMCACCNARNCTAIHYLHTHTAQKEPSSAPASRKEKSVLSLFGSSFSSYSSAKNFLNPNLDLLKMNLFSGFL